MDNNSEVTPEFVYLTADGRWPSNQPSIRPVETNRGDHEARVNVVVLGAGLSKAANADSPLWNQLVAKVAEILNIPITGQDPRADAMTVSWRASQRPRPAIGTRFQHTITDYLNTRWNAPDARVDDAVLMAVAQFLRSCHCDVVVDLNYDRVTERMLDAARIPYYRIVGAQVDVHPPLPGQMVVLWKIHGSIDYPPTIVLSPTDYQRIYEVNELGAELVQLGARAHMVWTIGVGLQDDDVWSFLTADADNLEIVALSMERSDVAAPLDQWMAALGKGVRKVTVLSAALSPEPPGTLRHCVEQLNAAMKDAGSQVVPTPDAATNLLVKRFDDLFEAAQRLHFEPAVRAVVDQFAKHHDRLVHFLLTPPNSSGHRWLPFLKNGTEHIDDGHRATIAAELVAILARTREFVEQFGGGWPNRGLLPGSCAQSVVRYVFELLESFEIEHRLLLGEPPPSPMVRRGGLLVGANPFEAEVRSSQSHHFSTMQVYHSKNVLPIAYPLVARGAIPAPAAARLLTEDEWEAAVISLYLSRKPRLEVSGARETFELDWTWPIFPWGFGRNGLGAYRRTSGGTVTQSWHLVENKRAGSQICKGGSLRDRGEKAFMIARRGTVRIGEYDDFVQPSA